MPVHTPTPRRFPLTRIAALALLFVGMAAALFAFALFFPDILRSFEPKITQKYDDQYATNGNYVYFMDKGYKKVKEADPATFRSLYDKNATGRHRTHGRWSQIAGRDKNAVFIGKKRIAGLDPEKTRVVFGQYVTDGASVYDRSGELLPEANPATFEHIIGRYARDDMHLYYEANLIPEADLDSLDYITQKPLAGGPGIAADILGNFRSMDDSRKDADYLKDVDRVYFKGAAIPKADPDTFRVLYVEGDQWRHTYAQDALGYYFEGKPLPGIIEKTGEKLAPGSLKLLQADKEFGWAELFYSGPSIYAFNTKTKTLEPFFTRETAAPFTKITRGVYADDRNVFFSARKDIRQRGKGGQFLTERRVYLQPLANVAPEDFEKVDEIKGPPSHTAGEIFEANGVRYFHRKYADGGAALDYLDQGKPVPIPLLDEFSHATEYGSPFRRHGTLIFALIIAVTTLASMAARRYAHRLKKSKPS